MNLVIACFDFEGYFSNKTVMVYIYIYGKSRCGNGLGAKIGQVNLINFYSGKLSDPWTWDQNGQKYLKSC